MNTAVLSADVVMLGTFAAWNLGTIQARALPLATELRALGIRPAIVVTPWDLPSEAGTVDVIGGVPIINTHSASASQPVSAIQQQVKWVRRLSPSVLHVFKPKGFGGFAGRLLSGSLPLVVDSDDWEGDGGWNDIAGYSAAQRRIFNYQEQDLLKRAGHVTAASTLLFERARQIRANDDSSVSRLPNGLTEQRYNELAGARLIQPSSVDPPTILLYSRFAEFESNWLGLFLAALSGMTTQRVIVRVVGNTPDQLLRSVDAGSIHVELMGYVAWRAVPDLLGSSSLAVYPYVDTPVTRSKQSVKLLEQMAAGCPVIASNVGDISSTLGDAGLALEGSCPEAFARTALDLLQQPARLDEMGRIGMDRVQSLFLFKNLVRDLLDVYRRAGFQK